MPESPAIGSTIEALGFDFGSSRVRQDKEGLFSAADLLRVANSEKPKLARHWLGLEPTRELLALLAEEAHCVKKSQSKKSYSTANGNPRIKGVIRVQNGGKVENRGIWINDELAIDLAAWVSPRFKIAVTRYLKRKIKEEIEERADPGLAAERGVVKSIEQYQRRGLSLEDAKKIAALRVQSIIGRKAFTAALKEAGVSPKGYALCTLWLHQGLFDESIAATRKRKGLPEKANLRFHADSLELAAYTLSEEIAGRKIKSEGLFGDDECADASFIAGRTVSDAVGRALGTGGHP